MSRPAIEPRSDPGYSDVRDVKDVPESPKVVHTADVLDITPVRPIKTCPMRHSGFPAGTVLVSPS